MADQANITRRAALVGALLSTAALAVPAVPAIAANLRPHSRLDELIARHSAAFHHLEECHLRHGRLDDSVTLPEVKVQVGRTAWAHFETEIYALARTFAKSGAIVIKNAAKAADDAKAWRTEKLAELRAEELRYQAARDACGLTATQAAVDAAADREMAARIEVAIYRPADDEEARVKLAYVRNSPPFRDEWHHTDTPVIDAMLMALCNPTNNA